MKASDVVKAIVTLLVGSAFQAAMFSNLEGKWFWIIVGGFIVWMTYVIYDLIRYFGSPRVLYVLKSTDNGFEWVKATDCK